MKAWAGCVGNLPNLISVSRGIAAVAMLFFPVYSIGFWVLYGWGGLSDMIDGPIARKLNAESESGSRIDSVADLFFVVCSGLMILPTVHLPVWVWLWIAAIGAAKIICGIIGTAKHHKRTVPHSISNKLTGFLLFCLPFAFIGFGILLPAVIVCTMATFSVLEDYRYFIPRGARSAASSEPARRTGP